MEFAFDKPYDDGLSKFQTTVLYNTGNGYIQNEPVPTPLPQPERIVQQLPDQCVGRL